jgi:hypothetical protein
MKGASFRVSTTFINWVSHSFFAHATHTTPSPTGTAACVACCDCPRVPRVYTHTPSPTSPATRPLACFQSSHVIEQSRMEIEALLGRHRSGPPWEYRWLQYHLVHQITQLDSDALRLEGHDGSLRGGLGCDTGNRSYTSCVITTLRQASAAPWAPKTPPTRFSAATATARASATGTAWAQPTARTLLAPARATLVTRAAMTPPATCAPKATLGTRTA